MAKSLLHQRKEKNPSGAAQRRLAFNRIARRGRAPAPAVPLPSDQTGAWWPLAFDAMAEPVWLMDAGQRILYCNQAARNLFGKNLVGRHCWEAVCGGTTPPPDCPFAGVCQTCSRQGAEMRLGSRWYKVTVDPLFDAGNKFSGALHVMRDVTAEEARRRQLTEQMEWEQHRLRMLVDLLPDFIFVKDKASRFLLANKAIAKAYGKTPAEMVSHTDADFLPAETARRCRASEREVLAGKIVQAAEATICYPDGKTRTMVTNMAPFRDARGAICGLAGIGRDITKRKRAEEELWRSEERYHTLFGTLIEGFCTVEVIFDAQNRPVDYRFLEVNPAFEKQTGLRNAKGRLMRDLVPLHEAYWFEIYGKIALTGKPAHFEKEARALSRYFDVHAYRVGGPESRKVAVLFNDITARKRSEHLLQRTNHTLQAIRDCHEAMLRAGTESELLDQICRIIVQTGGERMAWVGFPEHDAAKSVRVVAVAGARRNYLDKAHITWADAPLGRGPVGLAIRTGKVRICQDTAIDPGFAPWRKLAQEHGYGSAIALPLMSGKTCCGVLSIYAPAPGAFDVSEQLLLADLANDLAFGITMLRLRADRERLEQEILHSIEREQKRIGRDLHDGLGQLLVGAKFRSVYIERLAQGKCPELVMEARALETTLSQAINRARDLARGLNPVKVTQAGLAAALRKLADEMDQPQGPHCSCRINSKVKIPDHDVAAHLYHIAQEAVQNAVKHALASNVVISLAQRNGSVVLAVEDDGVGITSSVSETGMGLRNMLVRARLVGGQLDIHRRNRRGTRVACRVTLTPPRRA